MRKLRHRDVSALPKVTQPKRGKTTAAWRHGVHAFPPLRPRGLHHHVSQEAGEHRDAGGPRWQELQAQILSSPLLCAQHPLGHSWDSPQQGEFREGSQVLLKLRRPMTFRTGCLCGLCRLPLGCPPVSRKGLQAWPGWTRKSPQKPTGSEFAGRGHGPALSLLHWLGADLRPSLQRSCTGLLRGTGR